MSHFLSCEAYLFSNTSFQILLSIFCHLFATHRGLTTRHCNIFHHQKTIIYVSTPSLSVLSNAECIPSGNATLTKQNMYSTQRKKSIYMRLREGGVGTNLERNRSWRRGQWGRQMIGKVQCESERSRWLSMWGWERMGECRMQKGNDKTERGVLSWPAVSWLMMIGMAMRKNSTFLGGKVGKERRDTRREEEVGMATVAIICISS